MTLYFDNVLSAQRLQQQQPVFDLLLIKGNSCFFLGVLPTRSYMIFAPPTVNCSSNVHEFFFSKFARDTCSAAIVPTSKAAAKKSPHHQPHQCCKNHNRIHGVVRVCTCWTNENILNYYFLQKKTVNNL